MIKKDRKKKFAFKKVKNREILGGKMNFQGENSVRRIGAKNSVSKKSEKQEKEIV